MTDLMLPALREKLWHKMRHDLAAYAPEIATTRTLMCCVCGRLLPQECFDLEHIIPQRALRVDPAAVRTNPATSANVRAGNLLLCKKPLLHRGKALSRNGCNSWKGRFYDGPISELISGAAQNNPTDRHTIAALVLGYLAMVAEFGYVVVLMESGRLMREQFFSPNRFHRLLPLRHQMLLVGSLPTDAPDAKIWSKPFSFTYQNGACTFGARNFSIILPSSQDPSNPVARHVRFLPWKYTLRPDFRTAFS